LLRISLQLLQLCPSRVVIINSKLSQQHLLSTIWTITLALRNKKKQHSIILAHCILNLICIHRISCRILDPCATFSAKEIYWCLWFEKRLQVMLKNNYGLPSRPTLFQPQSIFEHTSHSPKPCLWEI